MSQLRWWITDYLRVMAVLACLSGPLSLCTWHVVADQLAFLE